MSTYFINGWQHSSVEIMYGSIAAKAQSQLHERFSYTGLEPPWKTLAPDDVVVTHSILGPERRAKLTAHGNKLLGGIRAPRAWSMSRARELGIPTVDWIPANDLAGARELSRKWDCSYILLKKSFTCRGAGVKILEAENIDLALLNEHDIFCRIIHEPQQFKVETCYDQLIQTWTSTPDPVMLDLLDDNAAVKARRESWSTRRSREHLQLPSEIIDACIYFSTVLGREGKTNYISFDFMYDEHGYQLTEVNLSSVAIWWASQFPWAVERAATGYVNLFRYFNIGSGFIRL